MKYGNGPLLVTRAGDRYYFFIEVGQGARHEVHAAAGLRQAVEHLLAHSKVPAFRLALEDLQRTGNEAGWDWARIARHTEE